MKRIIAIVLTLLMVLSLTACSQPAGEKPNAPTVAPIQPTEAPEVYQQQNYALHEVSDRLKLLSRASVARNGINCDQTASGIEFEAYIQGQLSFTVNCSAETYFTVFVNGERLEERFEAIGDFVDTKIVVGDLGEMGFYNIRIVKQNEAQRSLVTLKTVEFYGLMAAAPANKEKYIEFIGDSITAGYGNLWTKDSSDPSNQSGTALYQDGTRTYAYLAAQLMNADISVVSCSGIGIDRGYTNQNGNGFRMGDFYAAASYYRSKTEAYDFANARVPSAVVINLGTNDQSLGSTEAEFKAGVQELITFIRTSYNTDVPIVWAYNMMNNGRYEWIKSVMDEMGGVGAKLYMCELVQNKEGGNSHPSLVAHKIASQQLTAFINSNHIV